MPKDLNTAGLKRVWAGAQETRQKMQRIHSIMTASGPMNSPYSVERGHLLASSPSTASLSRRMSGASADGSPRFLSRRMSSVTVSESTPRPASSPATMVTPASRPPSSSGGASSTPFTGGAAPDS